MVAAMLRVGSSAPRPIRAALLSHIALAFVAFDLLLPALLAPPMVQASFWIDLVWIEGFAQELRHGALYPRWLSGSNGGLGAPVFYYYPPIAFYGAALFKLAGLGTYSALLAAAGTAWFAGGAAMLAWLRGCGRRALPLAALYMAMPYHVIDFYRRGAFAEFCCYALLPLLALGVRRAAAGRGMVPLAITYALLIGTHLPIALLTSLLLIGPWCGWTVWQDRHALRPIACGLALGIALAAVYLLPALTLQHHASFHQFWTPGELRPSNWTFFTPARWTDPGAVRLFIVLTLFLAGAAAVLACGRSGWALGALAICALVAGVVPGLWDLPLVAKVQFPWRALMLVEFALVTALAWSRRGWLPFVAFVPLLGLSWLFLRPPQPDPAGWTPAALSATRPEVLEYLPRGAPRERGTYSPWALALAARHRAPEVRGGETILPLFHFPGWQVRCGGPAVPTFADPATRLLRYRGGADCSIRRVPLPPERIGAALSVLALGALAVAGLVGSATRRRRWTA
jgi:hypothetical protein